MAAGVVVEVTVNPDTVSQLLVALVALVRIVIPDRLTVPACHQRLVAALLKRCPKSLLQGLHPSGDLLFGDGFFP